ncbi:MAG: hypothetical protein P8X80_09240 [Desulfobacterales bacterium]|jgi:hypothetical protein
MFLKKIISGVAIFLFMHGGAGFAQEDEISDEDLEIIQHLEILENLDLLEEDMDLLETMTELGDEDES